MMLNWNEYRKQLALGVKEIGQLSPDTVKGYVELSSAGQKEDLLGAKIRELIALAVAVTSRCDGCITVHTEAAIRHGATKEEIAEALVRDAVELICTSDRVRADQKTFRTADLGQRGGGVIALVLVGLRAHVPVWPVVPIPNLVIPTQGGRGCAREKTGFEFRSELS